MMKIQTLNIGDLVEINGVKGYFIGMKTEDGLSEITQYNGVTNYKGYLNNKYFHLEYVSDYGGSYELIKGDFDDVESIIEFVNRKETQNKWYEWANRSGYLRAM